MQHILIVEDDTNINNLLKRALEKDGYRCTQAFSGTESLLLLAQQSVSLIILDLMLPGMSGENVLKTIRKKWHTPIIVLTAKDSLDDKVDLLKSGADDYITKPFEIKEVLARVSVQIRRFSSELDTKVLHFRQMALDPNTRQIQINGTVLPNITKQEFSILELLLRHPSKVFSKEDIFEYAWDEIYMGETKTLDVHISNIRKKIKSITDEEYIDTIWGIGYRLHS